MSVLLENNSFYVSLIFDVSAILIVLIFLIINAKRGFAKTFISVIGYILAIILAGVISDTSAEPIYDSVLKAQNIKNIEEVLSDCDVSSAIRSDIKKQTYGINISDDKLKNIISSSENIYKAINDDGGSGILSQNDIDTLIADSIDNELGEPLRTMFPSTTVDYMINYMKSNTDRLYRTASILLQGDKSTAEYIEENFIRPVLIYILKMAIFFIVFFIVMFIVKLVSKTLENNNSSINIIGTTDRILGAILGLVEGCILLIIISVVLKLIIFSNVNTSEVLNDSIIQNTKIFKYIYNIDAIKFID